MAGEIDPKIIVASGEFYAGAIAIFLLIGSLWMWVKMSIRRSNERHDGHDANFEKKSKEIKELNEKIANLATKEDLKDVKSDIIREMYALFAPDSPAPVERRSKPR